MKYAKERLQEEGGEEGEVLLRRAMELGKCIVIAANICTLKGSGCVIDGVFREIGRDG